MQKEQLGVDIDTERQKAYNKAADMRQFERYKDVLGADAPQTFSDFQKLRYQSFSEYEELKRYYLYMRYNPSSNRRFFEANEAVKALREKGLIRATGTVTVPPTGYKIRTPNAHAEERFSQRGLSKQTAQKIVDDAVFALKQRFGKQYSFYSENGFASLGVEGTLGSTGELDDGGRILFEEVTRIVRR